MNKVTLCGRLVADPETRYSPGPNGENKAYTRYRIAVPRKHKKQNENPQSDFFSCVCFGTLAEFAAKYFRKGGRVLIAGRIENDNYVKDGQTIYGTKIIVEEQEFADSRRSEHENIQSQENITQNNTAQNIAVQNQQTPAENNSVNNTANTGNTDDYQRQFEDFMPTDIEIPFQ